MRIVDDVGHIAKSPAEGSGVVANLALLSHHLLLIVLLVVVWDLEIKPERKSPRDLALLSLDHIRLRLRGHGPGAVLLPGGDGGHGAVEGLQVQVVLRVHGHTQQTFLRRAPLLQVLLRRRQPPRPGDAHSRGRRGRRQHNTQDAHNQEDGSPLLLLRGEGGVGVFAGAGVLGDEGARGGGEGGLDGGLGDPGQRGEAGSPLPPGGGLPAHQPHSQRPPHQPHHNYRRPLHHRRPAQLLLVHGRPQARKQESLPEDRPGVVQDPQHGGEALVLGLPPLPLDHTGCEDHHPQGPAAGHAEG
mmetsp:Transcript_35128/g.76905  ORF Transcript_35128/g.76905 Transcript_35128/m.76905 type:complete len:300 (-) Transcript_35128:152-1051(-)